MRVIFLITLLSFGILEGYGMRYSYSDGREPPSPVRAMDADLSAVETNYINQKLNNFDENDNRTFDMRYLTNHQFFNDNGPILLMLGGEWEIEEDFVTGGHMYNIGKEIGAFLVYTEHRYYGQSNPLTNTSTENLQYLAVEQSLEDVAKLIKELKTEDRFRDSKVVVFGGSYAGSMATWMRLKYPDVVDGSVASCAPVLAKNDFFEYLETVNDALVTVGGEQCVDVIKEAMKDINEILAEFNGTEIITEKFNICNTINASNPLDMQTFYNHVIEGFSKLVQDARRDDIGEACDALTLENDDTPLDRVVKFIEKKLGSDECHVTEYDVYVNFYADTSLNSSQTSGRLWFYQTCTQFGFHQTTDSTKQPFGQTVPLSYFVDHICPDLFGEGFGAESVQQGIQNTNNVYGGLSPKVTNVVSIHGSIDPWHRLGITTDISENSPAVLVNGTAHIADLDKPVEGDNASMKAARKLVRKFVIEWTKNDGNM